MMPHRGDLVSAAAAAASSVMSVVQQRLICFEIRSCSTSTRARSAELMAPFHDGPGDRLLLLHAADMVDVMRVTPIRSIANEIDTRVRPAICAPLKRDELPNRMSLDIENAATCLFNNPQSCTGTRGRPHTAGVCLPLVEIGYLAVRATIVGVWTVSASAGQIRCCSRVNENVAQCDSSFLNDRIKQGRRGDVDHIAL